MLEIQRQTLNLRLLNQRQNAGHAIMRWTLRRRSSCTLNSRSSSNQTRPSYPSCRAREALELLDCIFVGILGVDTLAGAEFNLLAENCHALVLEAYDMHFDASLVGVSNCMMPECLEVERACELAVNARQKIKIEGRCHAGCIIVSGKEAARVFLEIDANDQATAAGQ